MQFLIGDLSRLLIGRRSHYFFYEPFNIPVMLHERNRQVIQQLGMGGKFALCAEVAGGFHNSPSEDHVPQLIDIHTGSQRIVLADSPFSQPQPVTRSEEHTSELQSLMRISYAVFCL